MVDAVALLSPHQDTSRFTNLEIHIGQGTVMATERETIYKCEVAFRKLITKGEYERSWKTKSVADAITEGDDLVRCKDCHGKIRLHGRHVIHGPVPHAEHTLREDSEYCRAGHHFRQSNDGRAHRISNFPVE